VKSLVIFELNEVPKRILEYFISSSPRSNLARLQHHMDSFETYADDQGHLSPWKTWPTVHRGTTAHRLTDLGQVTAELDEKYPPVWKLLVSAGVSTGVFGSLHTFPLPPNVSDYAFFIPDVFAPSAETHPIYVKPFQALSLSMSRQSGRNVSRGIPFSETIALLKALPRLGITAHTIAGLARQLLGERISPWKSNRRRTWQSVIAFDVFMRLLQTHKPKFVTFFTNHVASAMHRYWAATFPGDYESQQFGPEWTDTYKSEIMFAMQKADEMLGELVKFIIANPEYDLWVLSSMGQHAVNSEPIETQVWIEDPDRLMKVLGVEGRWESRPAMFAQYNFVVTTDVDREVLLNTLSTILISGKKLNFRTDGRDFFSLDFGQVNVPEPIAVEVAGCVYSGNDLGLTNLRIQDRSNASAYHIPQGTFLRYPSGSSDLRATVPTTELAPMILEQFGVPVPTYMKGNRTLSPAALRIESATV
jgi:hypothetical protein